MPKPEFTVHQAAVDVAMLLDGLGLLHCIIGGIAVQRWGEPRMTVDVDFTVLAGWGKERAIAASILLRLKSRIEDAETFAAVNRMLLLVTDSEVGIDISLGAIPYEERLMERSSVWVLQDLGNVTTCSAEDLVILKTIANRAQDWVDIERIVVKQRKRLRRHLIIEEVKPLLALKEEPEILDRLMKVFEEYPQQVTLDE